MKTLIGVFLGLLLFGCASTTPEGTALSDGSVSYTVTCEHDWSVGKQLDQGWRRAG